MYRTLVISPAKGESVTVSVGAAATVADGVIVAPIAIETTAVDVRLTDVGGVAVVLADGMVGVDVARVEDRGGIGDGSGVRVAVT
jgi:hypothetical protein